LDKYMGVSVNDPDIVNAIQNIKRRGGTKEQALRVVGMPYEVIDKHWQNAPEKEVIENEIKVREEQAAAPARPIEVQPVAVDEIKKQAARDRMAEARAARKKKV
jgi:hypothetical protein